MTPEEYQRIKEAEKAHLRKVKELKRAVRTLGRQQRLTKAVESLTGGRAKLDENEALIEQLALDTARSEARLDIALEGASEAERAALEAAREEELRRLRAAELLRQMKQEIAGPQERAGDPEVRAREAATQADPAEGKPEHPLPEKTIGRMRP